MLRLPRLHLSTLMLTLLCLTVACEGEPIAAPAELRQLAASSSGTRGEYASVQDQIAALKSLLAKDGGLDQLLSRGADTALITQRRQAAESYLTGLRGRLAELEHESASASQASTAIIAGEIPENHWCIVNLSADGCFTVWYSTIDHRGSGSVYQWTMFVFSHNTATYVRDNGAVVGIPRNTSNFGLSPGHVANYSFSPADPDCLTGDHLITQQTSHHIGVGIKNYGMVEGEQESGDRSQCFRKYLTVSVSPSSIGVGQTASITVGHLPSQGCAYGVTSSDEEVASIRNYGSDLWSAMGLSEGSVTITARCPDGTSGSASLSVAPPDTNPTPPPSGGGPIYRNDYESGDGSADPTGSWVCMLYWHAWSSWDGGQTWQDDGRECINWSWQEDAESRVADPSAPKPGRPQVLTRPGLHQVASDARSGSLASATSATSPSPTVTVVITPNAPRAGLSALTRRATGHGSPIVVRLHESELTPELLGAAFSAVPSLLAREARQRVKDSEYRVGEAVVLAPLPVAYKEWLREIIARLVAGDHRLGSEFGGSRAITVKLNNSP